MYSSESVIIIPLILILFFSLFLLFTYATYEGLFEITANKHFFLSIYNGKMNGDTQNLEKKHQTIHSHYMTLHQEKYKTEVNNQYDELFGQEAYTFEKELKFKRYNPRLFLLGQFGLERILIKME